MDKTVQKLGLGTVQFGIPYGISNKRGQTSPAEVAEILKIARQKQIQIIDTASAYGNAEKILGQYGVSYFRVVSKFMPPTDEFSVKDQLNRSLENLGLKSLYGYLAHRPQHLSENISLWQELLAFKRTGLIQKIGVSLNEPKELEILLKKKIRPDIIQVPFNYFDRRFRDWMISLKKDGCEIHSRSVFLQGLFFMDRDQMDSYFKTLIPLIENLQKTVENLPGALLNFVLQQPFIDKVIIGVENKKQFIENLDSLTTLSTLPQLNKELSESILIPSNWPE